MKDLVTNRSIINIDPVDDVHHYSGIASQSLVEKKKYHGDFIIPCTIWSFKFAKALYNLGARINLIPLTIYR